MAEIDTNERSSNDVNYGAISDTNRTIKKKRIVTSTLHPLPHRSSSIEQHLKIIKAYVIATNEGKKPVMYKDFIDFGLGFHYTYVSSNNKFLEEIGLIESTNTHGKYIPSKQALDYQRFTKWDQDEKALAILKELVKNSWFWKSAKQILLMQEDGIEEIEILNKLGVDSKADREKHMGSLKLLLDYLEYVELITRDEKTNKIKMSLELSPPESSSTLIESENQINNVEINESEEISNVSSSLKVQNVLSTEPIHYREEPGHFALRVILQETSIQLLEEELKYIKGKYALLQRLKKEEDN